MHKGIVPGELLKPASTRLYFALLLDESTSGGKYRIKRILLELYLHNIQSCFVVVEQIYSFYLSIFLLYYY
jgi:hypothetical protein